MKGVNKSGSVLSRAKICGITNMSDFMVSA